MWCILKSNWKLNYRILQRLIGDYSPLLKYRNYLERYSHTSWYKTAPNSFVPTFELINKCLNCHPDPWSWIYCNEFFLSLHVSRQWGWYQCSHLLYWLPPRPLKPLSKSSRWLLAGLLLDYQALLRDARAATQESNSGWRFSRRKLGVGNHFELSTPISNSRCPHFKLPSSQPLSQLLQHVSSTITTWSYFLQWE